MSKTNFLQTCIGIALVLFAAGFLIRSFGTAQAAPGTNKTATVGDDPFIGIGVADGNAYYLVKEANAFYKLKKVALSKAQDW